MPSSNNDFVSALIRKVAITGPESTGKSFLAKGLALHYNTCYVPEYARTYLENLGRDYTQDDLMRIAMGQLAAEQKAISLANNFIFCDTDFLVLKVWHMHRYKSCPPFISEQLNRKDYHLHLLCDIDLPWEFDPQREHPHLRSFFFSWYRRELENLGFPYIIISGQGAQRLNNAIEGINRFFNTH